MLKIDDLLAPVSTGIPAIDDAWRSMQDQLRAPLLSVPAEWPVKLLSVGTDTIETAPNLECWSHRDGRYS